MSSEQRWMIDDALGLLLQLSKSCCLAPVRFMEIRTNTFVYNSRPLLLFSIFIASIMNLCIFYNLYLVISIADRENYKKLFLLVFTVFVVIVSVSYAVLHSETRIKNYMTSLMKLQQAIRSLQCTEKKYITKWHVLIMFITLSGGTNLIVIFYNFIYERSFTPLTYILIVKYTMLVIVQQQFLYFAVHVSFVLKTIKEQLQEELSKIIKDKNAKHIDIFVTARCNIPLGSINKAIDMIGMTDKLIPEVRTTEKQNIAQRIHQINDCYILACEVMRDLSSSDGFLLFLILIYCSIGIVYCSCGIIKLFNQDGSLLNAKLLAECLQILVFAIRIIMIVEPCHMAHEKISSIRFLLSEIMCHVTSRTDPVFRVVDGFFHQLNLIDISYTALGICKVGRPLVTSIIAVVTTILITIFEF